MLNRAGLGIEILAPSTVWCIPIYDEDESIARLPQMRLPLVLEVRCPSLSERIEKLLMAVHARPALFELLPPPVDLLPAAIKQVFHTVRRLARARHPMPTNPILGEACGGRARQVVANALNYLHGRRYIQLERQPGRRRVMLPSGEATAWGEFPINTHAPWSRNSKLDRVPTLPYAIADVEKTDRDERTVTQCRLDPIPLVEFDAAETCQFPMAQKGRLGFCDAPVTTRAADGTPIRRALSYCPDHLWVCSPALARRYGVAREAEAVA